MDPDLMLVFPMVITIVALVGGMSLAGFRMWLKHRGGNKEEIAQIVREEIADAIHEELAVQMGERDREIEELHERMEFAERLLAGNQRKLENHEK